MDVGDNVKISFGLKREGTEASDFAPFSVNEYKVLKNGLEKVSGTTSSRNKDEELQQTLAELQAKEPASKSKPKDIVELLTWRANQMIVPMNFTKETQFMTSFK